MSIWFKIAFPAVHLLPIYNNPTMLARRTFFNDFVRIYKRQYEELCSFLFVPECLSVCMSISCPVLFSYLGSQLGAFCLYTIVYCYLEFKLRYLKNLKLFSIRVKELFESIVLRKMATSLSSFKSIFLRNRSLSNAR